MGKQRRQRRKIHLEATHKEKVGNDQQNDSMDMDGQPILLQPSENLFAGININLDTVKKDLDDTQSVKSFKSLKPEASGDKTISKKDKLKLRKEMLLKKIDAVNQMKIEAKQRRKRKNIPVIGDTNLLHDSLPSLESLLACGLKNKDKKLEKTTKQKGIEKATKRKKQVVQGVQLFKMILKDKEFQKDPLKKISQQVTAVVNHAKIKLK